MNPIDQSELQRAITGVGAIRVTRDRYAFVAGGWHSATSAALVAFERYDTDGQFSSREDAVLAYERDFPEDMARMPRWWEPDVRTVQRGVVPYRNGEYTYAPLGNAIFHGCAPSTIEDITADIETGEEILLDPKMAAAARIQSAAAILNLTQHKATPDQVAAGVVDLDDDQRKTLSALLTFDETPSTEEVTERANLIAEFASIESGVVASKAMVGGAPYLMGALERALRTVGIKPMYAFSVRDVVEQEVDGGIEKKVVFRHSGFVEPPEPIATPARAIQRPDAPFVW